jgi:hypothetical protein
MYKVKRNIPPQGVDEKAACTPHSSVIFETAETHHPTCASESVFQICSSRPRLVGSSAPFQEFNK